MGIAMNVSLTPELEKLVQTKVKTGRYTSASEVIREALRLMEARDEMQALRAEDVRQQIAAGMASLRAGRSVDGEAFFAAMDAELAELERSK
jgi:antitoxin ParD1/3/4